MWVILQSYFNILHRANTFAYKIFKEQDQDNWQRVLSRQVNDPIIFWGNSVPNCASNVTFWSKLFAQYSNFVNKIFGEPLELVSWYLASSYVFFSTWFYMETLARAVKLQNSSFKGQAYDLGHSVLQIHFPVYLAFD